MYNLIITSTYGAWEQSNYYLPFSRFCEHTEEKIEMLFNPFNQEAITKLKSLPTLFAYEKWSGSEAYLGQITKINLNNDNQLHFQYSLNDNIKPIQTEKLSEMDLGINEWEMNRTHWAVKDINLFKVLRDLGVIGIKNNIINRDFSTIEKQLTVTPKVFSIPNGKSNNNLVSVMMPFGQEFDHVYETIKDACHTIGLECKRADEIWMDSTIIQDVFNLIYFSAVVIVELSGRNPNVLYETGVAHTLGKSVIPISRDEGKLPFDLAHHRVLKYLPNAQGLKEMKNKLEKRLLSLTY